MPWHQQLCKQFDATTARIQLLPPASRFTLCGKTIDRSYAKFFIGSYCTIRLLDNIKSEVQSGCNFLPRCVHSPYFNNGVSTMDICNVCRSISFSTLPSEEESAIPHHETFQSLELSSQKCHLCCLILCAAGEICKILQNIKEGKSPENPGGWISYTAGQR